MVMSEVVILDRQSDRNAFLQEQGGTICIVIAGGDERLDGERLATMLNLELTAAVAAGMVAGSAALPGRRSAPRAARS